MANSNAAHPLDADFYQPAERFFPGQTGTALTCDVTTNQNIMAGILESVRIPAAAGTGSAPLQQQPTDVRSAIEAAIVATAR